MRRHSLTALVLGVISVFSPSPASAQSNPAEGALSARDSASLLRSARREQADFERLRRNRLPQTWGGGSVRCDERIGRFCLTHGSDRDDWVAPPEDEQTAAGRATLIDHLGQAAERIPGDGWIAGQRVRYLVEARRPDEAVAAAAECRAEGWWCSALRGFVHHYAGNAAEAEAAFADALVGMEQEERARWSDLTMILDDRTVREYKRMNAEARAAFETRFWHLADPLLTRPGNELRTEHFSRHVWDQLQFRADSPDGISWGYDLREIVLRYGWPTGWERVREWGSAAGPPPLTSHYSSAPRYLLPPPETLLRDTANTAEWDADLELSRTGYNVPLSDSSAKWFAPLDHQVAAFRRGAAAAVVGAYQLPMDSVAAWATIRAGIGVLRLTNLASPPQLFRIDDSGPRGALVAELPAEPVLFSLELLVPEERRLARARYDLDLTRTEGGISLSDLLLLDASETLPDSLPAALAVARGSTMARPGEQIGIYWEMYGLDPTESPEISLSIRLLEGRTGWLRRLAERAGILREVAPIRLRWQEPVLAGEYMARSLGIQVPNVDPGTYTLELVVEAADEEPVSVRRDLEITAP